jgi:adenylate cyclase
MLQFNTKFGEGSMWNLIMARYQTPRTEERIFMFADLNASTTIAEKLGDETYHQLLKDFFADITNPVLENKGEIYQYVGDEVVICWKRQPGTENNRCLACFFDMKRQIEQRQAYYLQRYGLVPHFKAGIHCGNVVAGEVGIIKRDITFSGDVLNTTSRILGMCKEYKTDFIASAALLGQLQLTGGYTTHQLGMIQLRGREQAVSLHAVKLPPAQSL